MSHITLQAVEKRWDEIEGRVKRLEENLKQLGSPSEITLTTILNNLNLNETRKQTTSMEQTNKSEIKSIQITSNGDSTSSLSTQIPADRAKLWKFMSPILKISEQQLESITKQHPPAKTVEIWRPISEKLFPTSLMCKNLVLWDKTKKDVIWLIVALEDTQVAFKDVSVRLGMKKPANLRFIDESVLIETLGVREGSVTPLAMMNDVNNKRVRVIIDKRMMEKDNQLLLFHPLLNEFTTPLTAMQLKTFLDSFKDHKIEYWDFKSDSVGKPTETFDY